MSEKESLDFAKRIYNETEVNTIPFFILFYSVQFYETNYIHNFKFVFGEDKWLNEYDSYSEWVIQHISELKQEIIRRIREDSIFFQEKDLSQLKNQSEVWRMIRDSIQCILKGCIKRKTTEKEIVKEILKGIWKDDELTDKVKKYSRWRREQPQQLLLEDKAVILYNKIRPKAQIKSFSEIPIEAQEFFLLDFSDNEISYPLVRNYIRQHIGQRTLTATHLSQKFDISVSSARHLLEQK